MRSIRVAGRLSLVIFVGALVLCDRDDDAPSLPSELLGTWSQDFRYRSTLLCVQSYSFREHDYTYTQVCGSDKTTYSEDVVEVFASEKMFRTKDSTWIAWHVEGNYLYLHKTNPYEPKPTLSANWWSTYTPWIRK